MRHLLLATAACAAFIAMPAQAQTPAGETEEANTAFGLGQIVVTGQRDGGLLGGGETLGQSAIETFNRVTLADAVNLMPGVNFANTGGSRNERLIFVRGFDRFQVPLSIDGVRVYRPADNRLDFGQFLTGDVAEVQVAKGYASVLDGPGAMGGAVNLVTRKPTKAIEAEMRGTFDLDREGDYQGYNVFGLIGTKQDKWYAQASYTRNFRDHWTLPGSFRPSSINENGGERDFSRTEDWRVNVKIGFTPNATDEYSISYTKQDGVKNAPLHVSDTSNASTRNWSWPYSTIESLYFLSSTALSDQATLKTQLYHTSFDNLLQSWDNRNQNSQTLARAFDSPYWDAAYGGSAELAVALTPKNTLSVAFHYRHDEHNEQQTGRPGFTTPQLEPVQTNAERTWSMAAENRYAFSDQLALTLGVSYDWRDVDRAEDYSAPPSGVGFFSFPLRNSAGLNGQGRLDWTGNDGLDAHVSLSSRVRFPTVFERFSSQFGNAAPNADLAPERATNAEIGAGKRFGPLYVSGALFYSWIDDALVSVRLADNIRNQRFNIGSANYYGGEISAELTVSDTLQIGGNYGYIQRDFDVGKAPIVGGFIREFQLTDVPGHKGFGYATWKPIDGLTLAPSVDWAGKRTTVTTVTTNANAPVYYKTGDYILANMRIDYAFSERFSIGVGARNIFDELYQLTDGFPEQGRTFFATVRARY